MHRCRAWRTTPVHRQSSESCVGSLQHAWVLAKGPPVMPVSVVHALQSVSAACSMLDRQPRCHHACLYGCWPVAETARVLSSACLLVTCG